MKIINLNSWKGITNLFADFILKKIGQNTKTIIQVTDCNYFFAVNGITETKDVIDLTQVSKEFKEEFKHLLNDRYINVIDLIKYDTKIDPKDELWFTFYDSNRILYHQKTIDNYTLLGGREGINHFSSTDIEYSDSKSNKLYGFKFTYGGLQISSEFPYGFGLPVDRNKLYYSEYVCEQVLKVIHNKKVTFKYSDNVIDEDFDIDINANSIYSDKDIKSMILDVFDFDLNTFTEKISSYDVIEDLTNPLDKKPWLLSDKVKDLIIF